MGFEPGTYQFQMRGPGFEPYLGKYCFKSEKVLILSTVHRVLCKRQGRSSLGTFSQPCKY